MSRLVCFVSSLGVMAALGCAPEAPDSEAPEPVAVDQGLRNERLMYLASAGQTARVVKTPSAAYVELGGRRVRMSTALRDELDMVRQRGGAIHGRLRARLTQSARLASIPVVIKYARQPTQAATAQEAVKVESDLVDAGLELVGRAKVATLIFAKGSKDAIEQIARNTRVAALYLDEASAVVQSGQDDPVPYTQADITMWPLGLTGKTQAIGYIEAVPDDGGGVVQTYDENVMFQAGVTHTHPDVVTCDSSSECESLWPQPQSVSNAACQNQRCVSKHATGVASVIAQVAPGARLVMGNAPGMNPVSTAGIDAAYFGILNGAEDVSIVNQSFQAQNFGVQGLIEDDLARQGIFVTQAAGNHAGEAGTISWACRDNSNALCVGSHGYALQKSCYSNWENPEVFDGQADREEPDILAFGGDGFSGAACAGIPIQGVRVAGTANPSDTSAVVVGTSFAAPAAAASAALVRECFEDAGQPIDDVGLRSVLMGTAVRNSTDYRYSTPKGTDIGGATDWRDGAGVLGLGLALFKCDPNPVPGVTVEGGSKTIDLTAGEPVPWESEEPLPDLPPECPPGGCSGLLAQDVPPAPGDGRISDPQAYLDLGPLPREASVRFVLSWNSCERLPGTFVAIPDYDVFLYNRTKGKPMFGSMSFDNNNEGFDVDLAALPGVEDGDEWEIRVTWLEGHGEWACPDSPENERTGYLAVITQPVQ